MKSPTTTFCLSLGAIAVLTLGLLAGCRSAQEKALEQAKTQAASTHAAQQVQYVDDKGNTVTTTVQPPFPGQSQQMVSTQTVPPPPGQTPQSTKPMVTSLGSPQTSSADQSSSANGEPTAANMNSQPAAPVNLTVPAGTELAVRINETISVKHTPAGAHFTGEVAEPVVQNGALLIPRGTPVRGRVDASHRRGHFKGSSILELRLTSMTINGSDYSLDTHDNVHTKRGKGKRSAGWIGGMTGAGMLIGGIATGGVGLAIGAASGAGAGTLIAGTTGNRDITIPAESIQHFRLSNDLVVQNP